MSQLAWRRKRCRAEARRYELRKTQPGMVVLQRQKQIRPAQNARWKTIPRQARNDE